VEEWIAFRDPFVAALLPVGAVEESFALHLATTEWRRRRIAIYEANAARIAAAYAGSEAPGDAAPITVHSAADIQRYQAHLDRMFTSTLRQLERLQKTRRSLEASGYKTNSAPSVEAQSPVPTAPEFTLTPLTFDRPPDLARVDAIEPPGRPRTFRAEPESARLRLNAQRKGAGKGNRSRRRKSQ